MSSYYKNMRPAAITDTLSTVYLYHSHCHLVFELKLYNIIIRNSSQPREL